MKTRNFALLPLIVLLFAGFSLLSVEVDAQSKKDRKEAERLVNEGKKAFSQKNYRLALENYSKAAALVPNDPDVHFRKGVVHYFLKETDLAITELDLAAAKGYKPQIDVYKARWAFHKEKKNFGKAAEDVQRVLKAEPNNIEFMLAQADISMAMGAFQEAVNAYQKVILRSPNNGNLFYHLALAKSQLGDLVGQVSAAEEAVKKNTQFLAESYILIADARVRQQRYPEAMDAYKKALRSKPDTNAAAYVKLGELFRRESRINEAIEISKAGLAHFPTDGSIYTAITWYYSLAGRKSEAIEAGKAATRQLPDEPLGHTNLCRAYLENNQPEMAIGSCTRASRLKPDDGETNFYLGWANRDLQRPGEADKYYKKALSGLTEFTQNNPDDSDGFYLLGNAYYELGQSAKALEAYRKCLELNPRFTRAMFNLGIIYVVDRKKDLAMEQYNSLLNTDKEKADQLKAEIDKVKTWQ